MRRLFFNGTIIADFSKPHECYDCLVIENGKVQGLLKESEAIDLKTFDEVISLNGSTLIPGLHDPHIHLWKVGHMKTTMLDARGITSIEVLKNQMAEWDKRLRPQQWFLGRGYNESLFEEGRHPTREDLDEVFPDRPAWLLRTCAHIGIANSKALELACITDSVTPPPGGFIQRDSQGHLTGQFEESALGLIANHIPEPTADEYGEMILACQEELLSYGVTSATDPAVTPGLIEAYRRLNQTKKLKLRTSLLAIRRPDGGTETLPLPERIDSDFLKLQSIKLFSDGGLSGATASLLKSYKHADTKGVLRLKRQEIVALAKGISEQGFGVAIHAIGDGAIEEVVSAYEELTSQNDLIRPRIEHFGLPTEDQLTRFHALNGIAVPQAIFLKELGGNFHRYLHDSELNRVYPLRSMLNHEIPVALSSDGPVVKDINPWSGVLSAVSRKTSAGDVLNDQESMTVSESLTAYTQGAAIAEGTESHQGKLSVGFDADFAILKQNPFKVSPEELPTISVQSTWIAGNCIADFSQEKRTIKNEQS